MGNYDEYENKVTIKMLKDSLGLEQICGDESSLNRWIVVPDVNRPGLELTGFYKHTEPKRVLIIGDKEDSYIKSLDESTQRDRFEHLLDGFTPTLILSKNRECPKVLLEVAKERNFPILRTSLKTYRIVTDLISYLDEALAKTDSIHGVLLNVYGIGVLIVGESGMGKSEVALDLVRRGHVLVADDRVDVSHAHNMIVGRAPELLYGMLEIRGIGVIDVAKMFGAASILEKSNIDLVIKLERFEKDREYNRVGNEEDRFMSILQTDIPLTIIPVSEGRNMGVIIESAVTNFRLKKSGFDSAKEFEQRLYDFIKKQNEVK